MIFELKEETQEMLPTGTPEDLCVMGCDPIIFLTGVFKNGYTIGFWSKSPWGTTRDQDQGWAILNTDFEIIDTCQSWDFGPTYQVKEWRQSVKDEYGKATKLCDEYTGELFWKMSDC